MHGTLGPAADSIGWSAKKAEGLRPPASFALCPAAAGGGCVNRSGGPASAPALQPACSAFSWVNDRRQGGRKRLPLSTSKAPCRSAPVKTAGRFAPVDRSGPAWKSAVTRGRRGVSAGWARGEGASMGGWWWTGAHPGEAGARANPDGDQLPAARCGPCLGHGFPPGARRFTEGSPFRWSTSASLERSAEVCRAVLDPTLGRCVCTGSSGRTMTPDGSSVGRSCRIRASFARCTRR